MFFNDNIKKLVKIFIFAFLSSELHSSFTQEHPDQNPVKIYHNAGLSANAAHHASIRLSEKDSIFGEGHLCSGALVASSVVLTTANCVYDYSRNHPLHASELKIVMGTSNRYQRNFHTLTIGATHIYVPPKFDALTLRNNLAIIMLESDVPSLHAWIKPISFAKKPFHTLQENYEVTSWSKTEESIPSTNLQTLNATNLGDSACSKIYRTLYNNEQNHCISLESAHLEACPSDVGAPLVSNNQLVGLASLDMDCDSRVFPSVFSDIGYHSQWIQEKIGAGTNQNSSIWGTLAFLVFTAITLKRSRFVKKNNE